jgi:hypothetical protein
MQSENVVLVDVEVLGLVHTYREIIAKILPDGEIAQEFDIVAALERMVDRAVVPVHVAEGDEEERRKQAPDKEHDADEARVVEDDEQIGAHGHLLHHSVVLAEHSFVKEKEKIKFAEITRVEFEIKISFCLLPSLFK